MSLRVLAAQYGGAFLTEDALSTGNATGSASTEAAARSVRFVLPGELIELDSSASQPFTILESSADRIDPGCRHFGACGGCDYQHATYPMQLRLKQQILLQTLRNACASDLPAIQTHSSDPWHYRNRMRLRAEVIEGIPQVGYNRRATREFLPISECPISSPVLWRAAQALLTLARENRSASIWFSSISDVEFQTDASEQALQMIVLTRDARTEGFAQFCEALSTILPELIGAGTHAASAGPGGRERAQWGAAGLNQHILNRSHWLTRGGFFQINRFLLPKLVTVVTANRSGLLAWDLYAGVGLFSRVLAESFDSVVAVESNPIAAADLARTPRKSRAVQAVESETATFLRRAVLDRARPTVVVVDPPRAGLGQEVCLLLVRIAPSELVYVSCDPTTLARDLVTFQAAGYRITDLHLLDLFPQTFHLETAVFLSRERPA